MGSANAPLQIGIIFRVMHVSAMCVCGETKTRVNLWPSLSFLSSSSNITESEMLVLSRLTTAISYDVAIDDYHFIMIQ